MHGRQLNVALKVLKRPKTWFKFFLGILLLNLIVIILANPVSQLISIGTGGISQNIATVIAYIVTIVVILVRLFIYYINILATIQYYNLDGKNIDPDTKRKLKRIRALQMLQKKLKQVSLIKQIQHKINLNLMFQNKQSLYKIKLNQKALN